MFPVTLEIKTLTSKIIVNDYKYPTISELWEHLDNELSYDVQNSFFMKALSTNQYIREQWDGRQHLFSVKTGQFLTGLLPRAVEALTLYNIPYDINDFRMIYDKGAEIECRNIQHRRYQQESIIRAIELKRGIIHASPRSGKTICEILLVAKLNIYPVLSICQSLDIARQTIDKFKQFLPQIKVGFVGDGECNIQPVTIATIQSLMRAYDIKEKIPKKQLEKFLKESDKGRVQTLVETAKVIWYDEVHHVCSATSKYILQNKTYAAEYILGCSGTPFREDNTNILMEGLIGPIIYSISYSKLIEEGFLVRPTIHLIKVPKDIVFDDSATYQTIYKKAIIDNKARNDYIITIAADLVKQGKSCMILVTKISHGETLARHMSFSKFVYSKSKDREMAWEKLKSKSIKCVITTLGDEGLDIQNLDAVIIASGGESAIKAFQRMRCMTPYPGKKSAIIVDFLDPYKYLKRHSSKRMHLYRTEPLFRVVIKERTKVA
jgi:superfamily II DNA or RNA helicase